MKKRILVLDDDKDILDIVSYLLTDNGYEVESHNNGEYILEKISKFSPDLVLIDLMLAGLDGRSLCQLIKLNPSTQHLPVIMITARPDLKPRSTEQYAPDGFIEKPFDIDNVLKKVAKFLEDGVRPQK